MGGATMTSKRAAGWWCVVSAAMIGGCASEPATPQSSAREAPAATTATRAAATSPAATSPAATTSPMTPPSPFQGITGYLPPAGRPSSVALVPPPPAEGSAALARDQEINRRYVATHGTPRWDMAIKDAVLTFPAAAEAFSCAINAPITEQETPRLYSLMRRTMVDGGRSTAQAKDLYKRARPFMVNGKPLCTPEREDALRADGSYPSGHSAIGWTWALVLTEVAPDRADAILARGRAYGESRLACNVHWPSDVEEGRTMASATVARLHAEPAFRADVEAAAREVVAVRGKGLAPSRDCAAEAWALKEEPSRE
jgi:acid phosphatase (class A)